MLKSFMNSSTKLLIGIIAFGVIIFAISKYSANAGPGEYDEFAKCLTEKGVTMYGVYWCPHCQNQKKLFGSSVKYINYVECDPRGDNANPDLCKEKGVTGYPMWELSDGSFASGEQSLNSLASKSGCILSQE